MDVGAWLGGLGLPQYERAFRENDVDAEVLPELTEADLERLGVASLGHRKRLLKAITDLRADAAPAPGAPKEPLERQARGRSAAGAERRQLTVMFVDLVGSTALSRRLDPEEMSGVLRAFQDAVAGGVARFDGHVAKFLGDGVLCYFGWPRAHEDDAERAVRAGIAVTTAVAGLPAPDGGTLACRVGIATGPVVVGELIGTGFAAEEAVVGETPNLAARLQGLAEPGAVVVAERTRRLLGGLFAYGDLGPRPLKGFAEPVRAWRVTGEGAAESRFDAWQAGAATLLVGREHELSLLLERWERAKEGEGQVVLLSGEAGIGKSRLVRALREQLETEPHTPLAQFCSPYHANTALHPVVGLLERAAGLRHEGPPEHRLDKLEAMLALTVEDLREGAALLADLLGIPAGDRYPPLDLSPRQRKARTFQVLLDQLAGLAAKGPVLALYEDAHWADPTTLELIGRVVEQVQRLPVLVLVTFRPEFAPPWGGHGHVTALSLGRLGRRQGGAMVGRVAGGKALPTEVLDQILARTDGVPLFVEELTKAVLEAGLLVDKGDRYELAGPLPPLAIPSTLQDSLMARLDRLAPVKEVAQVAACIGREFPHELIAAVVPLPAAELDRALAELTAAELVFARGTLPDATYSFKHALVRDAAYQSLLKSRRQQLHGKIAAVLEERFPHLAESQPELLAYHAGEAGLLGKAADLWASAGGRALARAAHREAATSFERALAALGEWAGAGDDSARIIDLRLQLDLALYPTGKLHEASANLAEAERLAGELGDPGRLCLVLARETYLLAATGDLAAAIEAGRRAVELTTRTADVKASVDARPMLARALYARGRYREAVDLCRAVIGNPRLDGLSGPLNPRVCVEVWLMLCLAELGEFEEAAARLAAALRLAGRLSKQDVLWARLGLGRLAVLRGDHPFAIDVLEPVLPLCDGELAVYFGRVASSLGSAYARTGRVAEGIALLRQAVQHDDAIAFRFGHALVVSQLADALRLAGQFGEARATACGAVEFARSSGELGNEGWALRSLGEVDAANDPEAAKVSYRASPAIADRLGMTPLRGRCQRALT